MNIDLQALIEENRNLKVTKNESLFQYVDLVKHRIFVTNFIRKNYYCPICRKKFVAPLPSEIGNSPFGPRLQALVSVLTGRYHLLKKGVPSLIYDLYRFKMSSGVVSKIEARVGSALKPISERIKTDIHSNNECTHVDETTWRHAGKNCFVWQIKYRNSDLCEIHFHRNKEARDHILGRHFRKPFSVFTDTMLHYQFLLKLFFITDRKEMSRLFQERLEKIEKTYEDLEKIEERLESLTDSPRKAVRLKALRYGIAHLAFEIQWLKKQEV